MSTAGNDAGRRWWSARWLEVIEDSGPALARQVQRGQALARRAGVEQVTIERGRITGVVLDEQSRPKRVELVWPVATQEAWERAVALLAGELRFTAAVLEGDLPPEAADELAAVGVSLVPARDEVSWHCPCRERPRPCRHAIALWTAVATLFDRDVFALLRLRGRDEAQLLSALRAQRGDEPTTPAGAGLDLSAGLFAARGDLESIALHPAPAEDPAALFRQLGEPPGVGDTQLLEQLIERSAATAWRLAAGEGAEAADEELLLAELRAQRVATPGSLAQALGRGAEEVRAELDRLFSEGTVLRTGSGDRAKYRASAS